MRAGESEPVEKASARVTCEDGLTLGAQLFSPRGAPRAIAAVAPAMAVVQRMYRAFAANLASHGIASVTFDYRGMGESAPPTLKGFQATVTDWATRDLSAVIDHARERFGPKVPTFVVGHSIGGQILGLCPRAPTLEGAVLVAAQSGYWKNWSGLGRALVAFHAKSPIELRELTPAALHARAIGHFGIFRREFKGTFHAEVAGWILDRAGGKAAA